MPEKIKVVAVKTADRNLGGAEDAVESLRRAEAAGYKWVKILWREEAEAVGCNLTPDTFCLFLLRKNFNGGESR